MAKNETIIIIDYGMGNISSIRNMLRYLGYDSTLTNDRELIRSADRLILPGVGNYKKAMENIRSLGLEADIRYAVIQNKKPILGICLGMQLLLSHSEEGDCDGLGLIDGMVKKFNLNKSVYKVPHMGWDYITIKKPDSPLFEHLQDNPRYYFVHSYYAACDREKDVLAETEYGIRIHSIIGHGNIVGVQFHPEKSHKYGMRILHNFLEKV